MFYARTHASDKADPVPGARGLCPTCASEVYAKCGQLVAWHWAHVARPECDEWAEADTVWHRDWQAAVPLDRREVVMGTHRADAVTANGTVVEFQSKALPERHVHSREDHYGRMVWVFDARDPYAEHRLSIRIRRGKDYLTFRWKHPRKSVSLCRRPVFLDIGKSAGGVPALFLLKRIHTAAPCGGWGYLVTASSFRRWMSTGERFARIPADPIPREKAS